MNGELHNAMGDIYMDYMDIPESVVSRSDFEDFRTAYYIYDGNPMVANAAAFLKEASEIYDLPGVTQYTFDPQRTINTAMEADFNARVRSMLDEAYAAGEGGMSAGEFAQGKGVPVSMTDADAEASMTMKMDGEGDVGYNGGKEVGIDGKTSSWGSKKDLIKAATTQGKGGVTPVGRAFQKHAGSSSRAGTFVGEVSGNATKNTEQGVKYILEILDNPHSTYTKRITKIFGEVLDVRLPDGTGARWSADGTTFIMLLEKYTPIK